MPGGVGWPTQRAGRAREVLPESQECWEALLESQEGLGGLGGVGMPSRRFGRGREGREGLGVTRRRDEKRRRPSWREGIVREEQIGSGVPPGGAGCIRGETGGVRMPSRRDRSGWETLPECREW